MSTFIQQAKYLFYSEGALLQTDGFKKRSLVVSTLAEAEFFADSGHFQDILYGFPLTADKIERCRSLNQRLAEFHVMIDSYAILKELDRVGSDSCVWSIFIAVDCGYGREGVPWDDDRLIALAGEVTNGRFLSLAGIYTHCGHSYNSQTPSDVARTACTRMSQVKQQLEAADIRCSVYGIGSTPSCSSIVPEMQNVNEMHPGNYIFYDLQQHMIGSCSKQEIACTIATRIIGHYPERNELLIDCGFTARTKQGMDVCAAVFKDHSELRLVGMTQEIGIVSSDEKIDFTKFPVGSMILQYPWHSCASAGMHPAYFVHVNGVVTAVWKPCRGW
uniref:D-serine dehydratase-like domain-containing protein n=1 Tax=Plectus sambesii TaxID=2011161 RepID=A0A914W7B3_9BILA